MRKARAVLAGALVAALAGCTGSGGGNEDPDMPLPDDARPFGPDEGFPDPTVSLATLSSDDTGADPADALEDAGYTVTAAESGELTLLAITPSETDPDLFADRPGLNLVAPFRVALREDDGRATAAYFDPVGLAEAVEPEAADHVESLWAPARDALAETYPDAETGEPVPATYTAHDSDLPLADLVEELEKAAEKREVPLDILSRDGEHATLTVGYPDEHAEDLAASPETRLAAPVTVHLSSRTNGTRIGYFDPYTLVGAVDPGLEEARAALSTHYSELVWEAA
ncbi:hypothetical protein [Salininema proteolyticum]|uniref:Uncharacterized protein n=1 Tax=Salininema proteolyticum TaxID=1607685 RepID=A0ABV8U5S7_9ACTN